MTSSKSLYEKVKEINTMPNFIKSGVLALAIALTLMLTACVGSRGEFNPNILAPTVIPTYEATGEPMPNITAPVIDRTTDILGNAVQGANHFERYLNYFDVQVYEQFDDTFVDMKITNSYPEALKTALKITFFDKSGTEIASAMFQSQDGQYAMVLPTGESTLYAQVNTDTTVTDFDFTIEYDTSFAVMPESW